MKNIIEINKKEVMREINKISEGTVDCSCSSTG